MVVPKSQRRKVLREFQAVIMAGGRGSSMMQLTSDFPKALLSVGNKPLIWYPLNILEKNGFKEVIVVVNKTSLPDIKKTLKECLQMNIHINYFTLPDDIDPDNFGTVDALLVLKEKIEHNLLVMSCDFVCDNFSLTRVLDFHDLNDSSVTVMFSKAPNIKSTPVPRPEFNRYLEKEYVLFSNEHPERLLFMSSESNLDKKLCLEKYTCSIGNPSVTIRSDLLDCHLYLIKKDVLQLIEREKFTSLRTDFLPWLIDATACNPIKALNLQYDSDDSIDDMDLHFELAKAGEKIDMEKEMQSRKCSADILKKILCCGYIADDDLSCIRVNSLVTYCEGNRMMAKRLAPKQGYPKLAAQGSQICSETLLGSDLELKDGVSVKSSVIGCHCSIGHKSNIANCVIMNNVTINENVTLSGCIISENASISSDTEMKGCLVSKAQNVTSGLHTNEEFLGLNHMIMIGDDDDCGIDDDHTK